MYIYENINPAYIDNLQRGCYFTPVGLSQDIAVMLGGAYGHVIDCCVSIGGLAYRVKEMDSYNKRLTRLTCIEINPDFVSIGKKLLREAEWICADVFNRKVWERIQPRLRRTCLPLYQYLCRASTDIRPLFLSCVIFIHDSKLIVYHITNNNNYEAIMD